MKVKNIVAALVVATIAAIPSISMNAQETSGLRELKSRSAEEVVEARKSINDASIVDLKSHYADVKEFFDGNTTTGVKARVKKKAYQGVSFGPILGAEMFAEKFTPVLGVAGQASFRKFYGELDGYATIGYPDELSDDQKKYLEGNIAGIIGMEVAKSKNLEHVFRIGAAVLFKFGKNSKYVDLGNGGYVHSRENAFNVGAAGVFSYVYSPKWGSTYHVIEARVGANHKLHTDGKVEDTSFAFGGKKAYFQATLTYKLMFALGKRSGYNQSLKEQGYTESKIKNMGY